MEKLRDHVDGVLQTCLHCGMCLPVCPTYDLTMDETSSPRGRIRLMAARRDGTLGAAGTFAAEMNFCLDCRACETACPAGVRYGELVEDARARLHEERAEPALLRLKKFIVLRLVFGSARRFSLFYRLLRLFQVSGIMGALERSHLLELFPASIGRTFRSLPVVAARPFRPDPGRRTSSGEGTGGAGLLTGCVMNIAFPEIHRDTVEVLERNGVRVRIPESQFCCGSLHAHNGDTARARELAGELIAAFPPGLDAVVVNSAGCGAFMKQYGRFFEDDPAMAARAADFSSRVRDVSEYLSVKGFRKPAGSPPGRVTYHDPCHLLHGQGVSDPPREILRALPSMDIVNLPDSGRCCGSAGIYNILQGDAADEFLRRKVERIRATGATIVCTANPGCHLQIARGLDGTGPSLEVVHPVTLLNRAYHHSDSLPAAPDT